MGLDGQTSLGLVIRVSCGPSGRWEVSAGGFDDPLASFDARQQACDYANRLATANDGAAVVMLDEGSLRPAGRAPDSSAASR